MGILGIRFSYWAVEDWAKVKFWLGLVWFRFRRDLTELGFNAIGFTGMGQSRFGLLGFSWVDRKGFGIGLFEIIII